MQVWQNKGRKKAELSCSCIAGCRRWTERRCWAPWAMPRLILILRSSTGTARRPAHNHEPVNLWSPCSRETRNGSLNFALGCRACPGTRGYRRLSARRWGIKVRVMDTQSARQSQSYGHPIRSPNPLRDQSSSHCQPPNTWPATSRFEAGADATGRPITTGEFRL